jgi:hypothetical protein
MLIFSIIKIIISMKRACWVKATSVTFCGSFEELVKTLRKAARTNDRLKVINIFPETGRNQSITGDLDSLGEYCKNPGRRRELLKQGKVRIIIPFFENKIPDLEEILNALYPNTGQEAIECLRKSFDKLKSELREIRRRVHISRLPDYESLRAQFDTAIDGFNTSLQPSCERWQITPENFGPYRLAPSKPVKILGHSRPIRPRPARREWEFKFPLTIAEVEKLINFAETWGKRFRNKPKVGRPPKPFNVLLFYVVNALTKRCLTPKREYIIKDGKFRVRKNWQLVCAAILWLYVLYDIPEVGSFIKSHKDEEAGAALKKFVSWAKREYSHFRESGKGQGKYGPAFPDGSGLLNFPAVYLKEDDTLSGQLL